MGERVAHEVDAAALPGGAEHARDGGLDAFVGVGDDKLDAAQAAAGESAQERRPEGLGLGRADVHAKHLASSIGVDADGDDDRDGDAWEPVRACPDEFLQWMNSRRTRPGGRPFWRTFT
jgi:hypothetical protein